MKADGETSKVRKNEAVDDTKVSKVPRTSIHVSYRRPNNCDLESDYRGLVVVIFLDDCCQVTFNPAASWASRRNSMAVYSQLQFLSI